MEQKKEYTEEFGFLYRLQHSGITNMFGAPKYLEEIGYSRKESNDIFLAWTKSWNHEDYERETG